MPLGYSKDARYSASRNLKEINFRYRCTNISFKKHFIKVKFHLKSTTLRVLIIFISPGFEDAHADAGDGHVLKGIDFGGVQHEMPKL